MYADLERMRTWGNKTATDAWHALFIPPELRTPITLQSAIVGLVPSALVVYMAYLSRRPHTYHIRVSLLPIVVLMVIGWQRHYYLAPPINNLYNWGLGLITAVIVAKVLQFGLSPRGVLKEGELCPGTMKTELTKGHTKPESRTASAHVGNGHGNGHTGNRVTQNGSTSIILPSSSHLPRWLLDVVDICFTMRGYGWEFGRGVHRPKDPRPMEKFAFLRATIISLLGHGLYVDFAESVLKLFPGIRDEAGGSMYFAHLPFIRRYALATVLNCITGQALYLGIEGVYEIITVLAVFLFDSDPSEWPPAMDHPFASDSLHGVWAKNWHQLLRQTFIIGGGIPGRMIGGNVGMVLGTFLASGLYHEVAIQAMGRGWDWMPVLFFAIQGPLLIGERLWRSITGYRVSGWPGRLWVYLVLLGGGQIMLDSWLKRGLGGGMMIPPILSPMRQIIFPLLRMQDLVDSLGWSGTTRKASVTFGKRIYRTSISKRTQ